VDKEEIIKQTRQKKEKKDKKGLPTSGELLRGNSAPVTGADFSGIYK
jgi:hypothetical protein